MAAMTGAVCQNCSWFRSPRSGHYTTKYLLRKAANHEHTNPGHTVYIYDDNYRG